MIDELNLNNIIDKGVELLKTYTEARYVIGCVYKSIGVLPPKFANKWSDIKEHM